MRYDKTERGVLSSLASEISGYVSWIDNNGYYDSIYASYKHSGQHALSSVRYFYFLAHLRSVTFAKLFWDILLNDWNTYQLDDPKTRYHHYGGSNEIPDYLQYYVRNFPSIPTLDNVCYKSTEVYAPRFKTIVQNKLPVADFKSTLLSKEQISYLGLKQYIEIDKCISLLVNLAVDELTKDTKRQIFSLYDEILRSYKEGNRITVDISSIHLLSLNNTYQRTKQLHHFNISSLSAPVNSDKFIQFPEGFSEKDKSLLCKVFGISTLEYEDLIFTHGIGEIDESLKAKLNEICPYLSVVISHRDSIEYDKIYTQLRGKINSIQVFKSSALSLLYEDQAGEVIFNSPITVWHEDDNFFFSGVWQSPLTLYSLCSLFGEHFGIQHLDRELSLFLQITKPEIINWLSGKGYEMPNSIHINENYTEPKEEENNTTVEEPIVNSENLHLVALEVFEPEVEPTVANVSNVKVNNITPQSVNYSTLSRDYTQLKNDEVKVDIGRWSEEYIFSFLNAQNRYTSIKWLNKDLEAYLPYDFVVVEGGKEIYIEVKGTPSKDKGEFYLSKNEWSFMFEKQANYAIYRLYNAGKKDGLEIKIIEAPYLLIQDGTLLPDSISVYI